MAGEVCGLVVVVVVVVVVVMMMIVVTVTLYMRNKGVCEHLHNFEPQVFVISCVFRACGKR